MIMRHARPVIVLCSVLAFPACAAPTGPDLEDTIDRMTTDAVRSAQGPWWGLASAGSMTLEFSLTQASDGRLQGNGTMREAMVAGTVPIAVSGTYNRPDLSLTFTGMLYEGRQVTGTFAGAYTSHTGVSNTLVLAGEGYSRSLSLLL